MGEMLRIGLLMPLLAVGAGRSTGEYVRIERLSARVVLGCWVGTGRCNLTAIEGQKGLAIIDTEMSPRIMAPIKARIERVFGRDDWLYVVNTHGHMHHTGGNCLFKGATVVGHDNLPDDMEWLVRKQADEALKRKDLEHAKRTLRNLRAALPRVAADRATAGRIRGEIRFWQLYVRDMEEGYPVVKPSLTFADRHTLDLGDLQLELVFFGRGHSLSDILIYIPQERLPVTGAIAYQRRQLPEIGEASQLEDVQRFLAVLDGFLSPDARIDRVIPSHSPPLRKDDLRPVRDYYETMLAEVAAAQREGLTLKQATARLAAPATFPAFDRPPPGHWAHGMQRRNIRNLWRLLQTRQDTPATQAPEILK